MRYIKLQVLIPIWFYFMRVIQSQNLILQCLALRWRRSSPNEYSKGLCEGTKQSKHAR
jgi:hypothetical protein